MISSVLLAGHVLMKRKEERIIITHFMVLMVVLVKQFLKQLYGKMKMHIIWTKYIILTLHTLLTPILIKFDILRPLIVKQEIHYGGKNLAKTVFYREATFNSTNFHCQI